MNSLDHNLSFVPPGRRDEVRRRIQVLTTYLKAPGVAAASAAATDLGLSLSSFYNLARAWETGRPEMIPGAGRPRSRKDKLSDKQRDIIREVARRTPKLLLQRAIEEVVKLGASRGVTMPSSGNLRLQIKKEMGPRLAADSFAQNSTFVIDHVAVDMPVQDETGQSMPIAAVVLRTEDGVIMGVNLTLDGPSPASVAAAVVAAAATIAVTEVATNMLAIESFDGPGWAPLVDDLARLPVLVHVSHRHRLGRTGPAATLLPTRIGGIAVRPRLAARERAERPATLAAGTAPLTLDEANQLIRARWLPDRRTVVARH